MFAVIFVLQCCQVVTCSCGSYFLMSMLFSSFWSLQQLNLDSICQKFKAKLILKQILSARYLQQSSFSAVFLLPAHKSCCTDTTLRPIQYANHSCTVNYSKFLKSEVFPSQDFKYLYFFFQYFTWNICLKKSVFMRIYKKVGQ